MGLDMNFYKQEILSKEQKAELLLESESVEAPMNEIGYFRKFYDLNAFMGGLYPDDVDDFNLVTLEITPEIWEEIKGFVNAHFHVEIIDGGNDHGYYGEAWNNLEEEVDSIFEDSPPKYKVFYQPWW